MLQLSLQIERFRSEAGPGVTTERRQTGFVASQTFLGGQDPRLKYETWGTQHPIPHQLTPPSSVFALTSKLPFEEMWVPHISRLRHGLGCRNDTRLNAVPADGRSALRYDLLLRAKPYFESAAARELFERSLETMRKRYGFFVTGYVVMPEHVHLLISAPARGLLSTALQALKLSVAVQRPERPFWQKRYHDFNVFSESKRVEKLRYIHRNPVKRGLVKEPDVWAWSSFRHWWTGEAGTVEIESVWTAHERDGVRERSGTERVVYS